MKNISSLVIARMNFIACVAVLGLHHSMGWTKMEYFVKDTLVFAVPWFLFASGLLFPQSAFRYSTVAIVKRKAVSLLVPYFIWSGFAFMLMFACGNADSFDVLKIFGISITWPWYNGPLGFLRKLIFVFPFALIFHICADCVKRAWGREYMYELTFLSCYIILWLVFHGRLFPFNSTVWFFLGCLCSRFWFGANMEAFLMRIAQYRWAVVVGGGLSPIGLFR